MLGYAILHLKANKGTKSNTCDNSKHHTYSKKKKTTGGERPTLNDLKENKSLSAFRQISE